MPLYNLLEYSKNYRKTIGSLYNYYIDDLNDDANVDNFVNNDVVSSNAFQYKNKFIGNMYNVNSTNDLPAGAGAGTPRPASPNYDPNGSGREEVEIVIP